jgi:hypothetical protein
VQWQWLRGKEEPGTWPTLSGIIAGLFTKPSQIDSSNKHSVSISSGPVTEWDLLRQITPITPPVSLTSWSLWAGGGNRYHDSHQLSVQSNSENYRAELSMLWGHGQSKSTQITTPKIGTKTRTKQLGLIEDVFLSSTIVSTHPHNPRAPCHRGSALYCAPCLTTHLCLSNPSWQLLLSSGAGFAFPQSIRFVYQRKNFFRASQHTPLVHFTDEPPKTQRRVVT